MKLYIQKGRPSAAILPIFTKRVTEQMVKVVLMTSPKRIALKTDPWRLEMGPFAPFPPSSTTISNLLYDALLLVQSFVVRVACFLS